MNPSNLFVYECVYTKGKEEKYGYFDGKFISYKQIVENVKNNYFG